MGDQAEELEDDATLENVTDGEEEGEGGEGERPRACKRRRGEKRQFLGQGDETGRRRKKEQQGELLLCLWYCCCSSSCFFLRCVLSSCLV